MHAAAFSPTAVFQFMQNISPDSLCSDFIETCQCREDICWSLEGAFARGIECAIENNEVFVVLRSGARFFDRGRRRGLFARRLFFLRLARRARRKQDLLICL